PGTADRVADAGDEWKGDGKVKERKSVWSVRSVRALGACGGLGGGLLVVAGAFTGCHSKTLVRGGGGRGSLSPVKQGKGVLLSDETQKLLGIEVAEVAEKPVERRVEKLAQVYRVGVGGERSNALILLDGDELPVVKEGQALQIRSAHRERAEFSGRLAR